jgi:hypothetical protein
MTEVRWRKPNPCRRINKEQSSDFKQLGAAALCRRLETTKGERG